MIGYGLAIIMWVINFVGGNNGNTIHMIFWRFTQATALLSLLQLTLAFLAWNSYG